MWLTIKVVKKQFFHNKKKKKRYMGYVLRLDHEFASLLFNKLSKDD